MVASGLVLAAGILGILLIVRGLTELARPRFAPSRVWRAISRGAKRAVLGLVLVLVGYAMTGLWIVLGYLAIGAGLLVMAAGVGLFLAGFVAGVRELWRPQPPSPNALH
jgi:hypothetical protein